MRDVSFLADLEGDAPGALVLELLVLGVQPFEFGLQNFVRQVRCASGGSDVVMTMASSTTFVNTSDRGCGKYGAREICRVGGGSGLRIGLLLTQLLLAK